MPRLSSTPLMRMPLALALSTISKRPLPSANSSAWTRLTELWFTEMVASSDRPMVKCSLSSGCSLPGEGPTTTTSRLGRCWTGGAAGWAVR